MAMPQMGFGLFQVREQEVCRKCVLDALDIGYRLIDTAAAYDNEGAVGRAIGESKVPRQDIFLTSKLWIQDAGHEQARCAFETTLEQLNTDYLDLYLIHQPFGNYYGAWQTMEELYREGRIRAIGVCNFNPAQLADLCINSEIAPMVNQIELHPFHKQTDALSAMTEYGVQPEAWGPLCEGQRNIFHNKVLVQIGKKYGKTAAQTALRWNIQRGVVVIPKSVHRARLEENFDIWDFHLTATDIKAIESLDLGYSEIIDHTSAATAKWLNQLKIHS